MPVTAIEREILALKSVHEDAPSELFLLAGLNEKNVKKMKKRAVLKATFFPFHKKVEEGKLAYVKDASSSVFIGEDSVDTIEDSFTNEFSIPSPDALHFERIIALFFTSFFSEEEVNFLLYRLQGESRSSAFQKATNRPYSNISLRRFEAKIQAKFARI